MNENIQATTSLTITAFKGRVGVGMGVIVTNEPIPILAFPLKGKER